MRTCAVCKSKYKTSSRLCEYCGSLTKYCDCGCCTIIPMYNTSGLFNVRKYLNRKHQMDHKFTDPEFRARNKASAQEIGNRPEVRKRRSEFAIEHLSDRCNCVFFGLVLSILYLYAV